MLERVEADLAAGVWFIVDDLGSQVVWRAVSVQLKELDANGAYESPADSAEFDCVAFMNTDRAGDLNSIDQHFDLIF
jgi:hypothetical protein